MDVQDMMHEKKQHRHHRLLHHEIESPCSKTDDEASASSSLPADGLSEDCWSLSAATPVSSGPPSGDLSFDQLIASPVPFEEDDDDAGVDQEMPSNFLPPDRGDQLRDSDDYDPTDVLLLRERDEAGNAFPFTLLSTIEEEDEELVASEPDSTGDEEDEAVDCKEDSSGLHASQCKRQQQQYRLSDWLKQAAHSCMLLHHLSISDSMLRYLMMETLAFADDEEKANEKENEWLSSSSRSLVVVVMR